MNTTTTETVHYNYGGNFYWGVPASGFCGSRIGRYTDDARYVSCASCRAEIADVRKNSTVGVPDYAVEVA